MDSREQDERLLRLAFDAARRARSSGNHPFGALIAGADGRVIATAENTVLTSRDATQHAETNVIRAAAGADLLGATLYTSTEPCLMCCGAIHWAGIARVVFGCPAAALARIVGSDDFLFPCREVFARTIHPKVEIVGPLLEDEAMAVHDGFWRNSQ